jgi:hypothetical protein
MTSPQVRPRPQSAYSNSDVGSTAAPASGGDTRRKAQSKRDEAIRKKIENELNRKRPGNKRTPASRRGNLAQPKRLAGTVSALRPLPALTVPSNISVADASQLCAAKRTDCVLVVDDDEHLCGIFTAKDLAFRVGFFGLSGVLRAGRRSSEKVWTRVIRLCRPS